MKNYSNSALSVLIPLGHVESLPRLESDEIKQLRDRSRAAYTAPPESPEPVEFQKKEAKTERKRPEKRETAETVVRASPTNDVIRPVEEPRSPQMTAKPKIASDPGRGGQDHKYLQHLVKRLAEERGFKATTEERILNGDGIVDVSIVQGKRRIACEISVTTNRDQELEHVEKCIAAGYREILLVGATESHAKRLAKFITNSLDENHGATIRVASRENLVEILDELTGPPVTTERVVEGYTVKTTSVRQSPEELAKRRAILAGVVARSIQRIVADPTNG